MTPNDLLLFRRSLKLKQADFGKLVGKNRPTISAYERGTRPMSISFQKYIELLMHNYQEQQIYLGETENSENTDEKSKKNACEKCGIPFLSEKTEEGYYLSVRQCACEFPPPLNGIEITLKEADTPAKVRRKTKEAIKTYMNKLKVEES